MIQRYSCRTSGRFTASSGKIVALLATGGLAMAGAPAFAQTGEIYGGGGGRYFEHRCGPGRVLVGLRGSAGVLIDNIQAICARLDGAGGFTDATVDGPIFGGNRPQDQHVECPQRYAVTGTAVGLNDDNPHVGAIKLTCTELSNRRDGGSTGMAIQGSGNLEGYSSGFGFIGATPGGAGGYPRCDANYAVGIRGRADQYLDAFGLICGPAVAIADPSGHTLGKRKRRPEPLAGQRNADDQGISSIPQTERTLGKRKRPSPTGGAGSESNPMAGQPAQTDGPLGASIFTDGGVQPEAAPVPAEPPSPLINGTYSTRLTVTDSRCIREDLRGSWQRDIALTPQPGILVPLNEFNAMFAGPVVLQVQGIRVHQSTTIPVRFGVVSDAPATFDGTFAPDASRFDVRFEAGNALCRVSGTIVGVRT